jgi:hypothetical protein
MTNKTRMRNAFLIMCRPAGHPPVAPGQLAAQLLELALVLAQQRALVQVLVDHRLVLDVLGAVGELEGGQRLLRQRVAWQACPAVELGAVELQLIKRNTPNAFTATGIAASLKLAAMCQDCGP